MGRANYDYELHQNGTVLVIYDLYDNNRPTTTVTNDMEAVLEDIKKQIKTLPKTIIYQDTEGIFDGVKYVDGEVDFYPLGELNLFSAIKKSIVREL